MKYKRLPKEIFIKRRTAVAGKLEKNSVALVFAAHQMPRNGDQFFQYRQNSDFFYLTGIEQEKSIVLFCNHDNAGEMQEVLFIIKADKKLETWEGHKFTIEEAREISGIKTVRFIDEFESILHSMLCISENIYFNLPQLPKFKVDVNNRDEDMARKIIAQYPAHRTKLLAHELEKLRLVKSGQEIEIIKKSCAVTRDAFIRVLQNLKPGMHEYEIEAEIIYEFTRQGATGHAYAPIVASGASACYLHYISNDEICKNGDLLLMDFGAEYANYAADLSRTVPVNGKFSDRQKDMYAAVLRVFKFARSLMVPGTTINKLHKEVCKMWEEEHIKLGLYTKEDAKSAPHDSPLWFNYFMHGTGHFLGLDVHDVGTRDTVLKPGMILTCEPGLYVPEEDIGIRIENNILITKSGNVDLMADIPLEIEEIEAIMTQ